MPGPTRRRREAEAGSAEPNDELATRHCDGAERERSGPCVFVEVVVVALERAARNADGVGHDVELVEIAVADEVTPASSAPRPAALVDETGHARHDYR